MITRPRQPTLHPAAFSYWEKPGSELSMYASKEPPHGARCGGCGKCAHCPQEAPNDPMRNHSHGWWREELFIEDDKICAPSEDDIEEWIVTMETYVSGSDITGNRAVFSSINMSIYPVKKGEKQDPSSAMSDMPNIVARAKTYSEVLKKYEEYILMAVRRERARILL